VPNYIIKNDKHNLIMSYTKKDRNDAIVLIGSGHPDISRSSFYGELESFNWIKICKLNGVINGVELTFLGRQLFRQLIKNLHPEWD
jgi:hypothetical protein